MSIIVFDFIDANRFIPYINENQKSYTKQYEEINYIRKATDDYFRFHVEWTAKYYTFINGKRPDNDFSTVQYLR
jgi:hypothetical protein